MTFEEAVAAPGRKVQVWGKNVSEDKRILMIFALGNDGAKQLSSRQVPLAEQDALAADLGVRGLEIADTAFECDFVWVINSEGVEVYDAKRKVLDATGDRATVADGSSVARGEVLRVMTYASDDYIHRGVKAALRSGKEVELVPEISMSAMSDPAYTRNELLIETGWTSTLGAAIAAWAHAEFADGI